MRIDTTTAVSVLLASASAVEASHSPFCFMSCSKKRDLMIRGSSQARAEPSTPATPTANTPGGQLTVQQKLEECVSESGAVVSLNAPKTVATISGLSVTGQCEATLESVLTMAGPDQKRLLDAEVKKVGDGKYEISNYPASDIAVFENAVKKNQEASATGGAAPAKSSAPAAA